VSLSPPAENRALPAAPMAATAGPRRSVYLKAVEGMNTPRGPFAISRTYRVQTGPEAGSRPNDCTGHGGPDDTYVAHPDLARVVAEMPKNGPGGSKFGRSHRPKGQTCWWPKREGWLGHTRFKSSTNPQPPRQRPARLPPAKRKLHPPELKLIADVAALGLPCRQVHADFAQSASARPQGGGFIPPFTTACIQSGAWSRAGPDAASSWPEHSPGLSSRAPPTRRGSASPSLKHVWQRTRVLLQFDRLAPPEIRNPPKKIRSKDGPHQSVPRTQENFAADLAGKNDGLLIKQNRTARTQEAERPGQGYPVRLPALKGRFY